MKNTNLNLIKQFIHEEVKAHLKGKKSVLKEQANPMVTKSFTTPITYGREDISNNVLSGSIPLEVVGFNNVTKVRDNQSNPAPENSPTIRVEVITTITAPNENLINVIKIAIYNTYKSYIKFNGVEMSAIPETLNTTDQNDKVAQLLKAKYPQISNVTISQDIKLMVNGDNNFFNNIMEVQ